MATKVSITISVKNEETGGGPLGGVEVELVGFGKGQTDAGGQAHFEVEEGEGYDLKVRSDALQPSYKDSGEFWLTEYVEAKVPADQRGRYKQLPGQTVIWGITFSTTDTDYQVWMKRRLHNAGTVSATPGGKVIFDQAALEVVIVAGTNVHDNTYGNKLMFLAQTVGAVRTRYSKEAYLSVLVFSDGYTEEELKEVEQRSRGYNGKLEFARLGSKQELVNYLNTRTKDASYDYRDRERILIKALVIYSHGVPSVFAFGLDLPAPRPDELAFGLADVASLKATAFNPGANLSSFACRTGNSVWKDPFDKDWKKDAKPEESLAQKLAEQLGAVVRAFITRSNYKNTYADKPHMYSFSEDPAYHADFVDLDDPGTKTGKAIWNRRGAIKPPISGDTPGGLNENGGGGTWIFEKGKDPRMQ